MRRTGRFMFAVALVGILFGTALASQEVLQLGEILSADLPVTAIETIVEQPDDWAGKRVRIEGTIAGVCARQGCWMDLASESSALLRVKVDDGVIVFPEESVGGHAVAEGMVEILELDRERYEEWLRHAAEEEEREFDPAEVGDGPYRVVRLRGVGAEISGP